MKDDDRKVIKVQDMGIQNSKRIYICILAGWEDCFIFDFYDDELHFTEAELIGKTRDECWELFGKKDKAYLQS